MPDVDWERVTEAVETGQHFPGPSLIADLIAAARWGLEAQQRGEKTWYCDNGGDTRCRGPVEQAELNDMWPRSRPHELCRWVRLVPVESEDRQ